MKVTRQAYGKGGKYNDGGVNDPRKKAILNEIRIANDPRTRYSSEDARQKDLATLQARLKALG